MNVEQWLGEDNKLGIDIWKNKYQYNNETFEEWLNRVSDGDEKLKQLIVDKKFLFGGRILSNRGLDKLGKKVTYSNCYVLTTDDSIEDIYQSCSDLARTFSYGGGCGLDLSKLRPKGMRVNNASKYTTGACSFMDTFSQVTETIGQNGRRGALMLSLDCTHPELLDFINIKTDLTKVTKANISVRITNDFMEAVKNNDNWLLYFDNGNESFEEIVEAKEVFNLLCKNNWDMAEPGILFWDTIENWNLLSEDENFEYAGVNPCAEEPLPDGGSGLLGSINLSEYVEDGKFNMIEFTEDIGVITRAMNDVLDDGLPLHPLAIQRDTVRDWRQIGIGVMGIADMLIKMGLRYDTNEALCICDKIGFALADSVIRESALLAEEFGAYPKYNEKAVLDSGYLMCNCTPDTYNLVKQHGLRNSQLLTIAPTGSISTMIGVSGGIEPIFNLSYTRKTESLHGEDVYYKVYTPIAKDYMNKHNIENEEDLPEFFVTTENLDPFMRVKMQGTWQKHIDASISSTINLPNEATVEEVEQLYMSAWEEGLKGLTIYRAGCSREGILTTDTKEVVEKQELKRGEWSEKPKDTIYVEKKIKTGCGKLKLFVGISLSENRLVDMYVKRVANGGCVHNIDALVISMSGMLRLGGSLSNIEKAFRGCGVCNSFTKARSQGKAVSKGVSCPTAILNAIKEVEYEYLNKEIKPIPKEDIVTDELKEVIEQVKEIEEEIKAGNRCPECNEPLQMTGGCNVCPSCGYSKCG